MITREKPYSRGVRALIVLVGLGASVGCSTLSEPVATAGGDAVMHHANPDALVTTEWLAEHLSDPEVRLIEINLAPPAFAKGHIPGAIYWNPTTVLFDADSAQKLDPGTIATVLERSGISHDTTIILHGEPTGIGAWVFWFLKTVGHDDIRVLDGGKAKWVAEGRPLTTDVPNVEPTSYAARTLEPSGRA